MDWFRSYLSHRKQYVVVDCHRSAESPVHFGVPQGSVLGPVLFTLYTTPLSHLIDTHKLRHEMYADDTQLFHSSCPSDYDALTKSLQGCVSDIKRWMSANRLKLNDDKTEAIRFASSAILSQQNFPRDVSLEASPIQFSDSVRNLGVIFDNNLTFKEHILKTCRTAYNEIRRISSIRHYLSTNTTKTLVISLVLSRLDYCNSLLSGCPQSLIKLLQQVQNSAAKLIFKARKYEHCSPLLKKLHWLPIEQRIKYKCACLCFCVITTTAPTYLSELFQVYVPSRDLRSSSDKRVFRLPHFKRQRLGGRAFSYAAAANWNSLPQPIRDSESLDVFKSVLKTHLFNEAFGETDDVC